MSKAETVTFTNTSPHVVKCHMLGLPVEVAPGEDVEIPLELCAPGRLDNGSRAKSAVESVCPHLTPKDPVFAEEWRKAPAPAPVVSRVATVAGREASIPAGVLAAREAKAKAEAAKAAAPAPTAKPATK